MGDKSVRQEAAAQNMQNSGSGCEIQNCMSLNFNWSFEGEFKELKSNIHLLVVIVSWPLVSWMPGRALPSNPEV